MNTSNSKPTEAPTAVGMTHCGTSPSCLSRVPFTGVVDIVDVRVIGDVKGLSDDVIVSEEKFVLTDVVDVPVGVDDVIIEDSVDIVPAGCEAVDPVTEEEVPLELSETDEYDILSDINVLGEVVKFPIGTDEV